MPNRKASNGYQYRPWPARANEARLASIDNSDEIIKACEDVSRIIEKARGNIRERLYQLVSFQLTDIESKLKIISQAAQLIQISLETAPAGNDKPNDDLIAELAEIRQRLEQLENQQQGRLRIAK